MVVAVVVEREDRRGGVQEIRQAGALTPVTALLLRHVARKHEAPSTFTLNFTQLRLSQSVLYHL